jgi:DNA-binding NarL/FixJ family response regulator
LVVIADLRLYREGLGDLLDRVEGMAVVGTAEVAPAEMRALLRLRPDVALIDMAMLDNVSAIRFVARQTPGVRIVALGVPETEQAVLSCVEAGIAAYVGRDRSLDDVIHAVRQVMRGETDCAPEIVASLFRRVATLARNRREQAPAPSPKLTRRELQIASLIANGLSNKEIAAHLQIELSTVKNHVHNVFEKLRISRRTQIAAWLAGTFDELGDLEPFAARRPAMRDRSSPSF